MNANPQPGSGAPAEVPHCYRHPGRETYVRCTRCDRYICPECMRDAAVGHQCVECVREGNRTTRPARTAFGGRPSSGPVVTYALIAINVAAFLIEVADHAFVARFEMVGEGIYQGHLAGVAHGEWYRLVTGAFLHSLPGSGIGITHILFNMWALWALGPSLEIVLGRARYIALYLLAAVGGNVLMFVIAPSQEAVGASGAIFGLFGAFFVLARKLNADVRGIVILLVVNLAITFAVPGIAWEAHIGGLVTGAVMAAAYAYAPQARRNEVALGTGAVLFIAMVVMVVVKTSQLTSGL
jgi:membrane associated rhomboid family serine protease